MSHFRDQSYKRISLASLILVSTGTVKPAKIALGALKSGLSGEVVFVQM